jgi:hypothetical protein
MKGVEVECATKFGLSRRKRRNDVRMYGPSVSRRLTFTLTEDTKRRGIHLPFAGCDLQPNQRGFAAPRATAGGEMSCGP